jgi:hypothetical protein
LTRGSSRERRAGYTIDAIHGGLDLPTRAVPLGEGGHTGDFRIEARGHQGDRAGSKAWAADVVADLLEPSRLWQGHQRFPGAPRGTGQGLPPGDEWVLVAERCEPA